MVHFDTKHFKRDLWNFATKRWSCNWNSPCLWCYQCIWRLAVYRFRICVAVSGSIIDALLLSVPRWDYVRGKRVCVILWISWQLTPCYVRTKMELRKRKACMCYPVDILISVMFANQYQATTVKKLTMWWYETFTHIYTIALYPKRWSNITNTNTSCNKNKWKLCCAKKKWKTFSAISSTVS